MANLIKILIVLPIFVPPLYAIWRVIVFFNGMHIHPALAVLAILISLGLIVFAIGKLLALILRLHDRMSDILWGTYMAAAYGLAAFGFHGDLITVGVTSLIAGAVGFWLGRDLFGMWVNSSP